MPKEVRKNSFKNQPELLKAFEREGWPWKRWSNYLNDYLKVGKSFKELAIRTGVSETMIKNIAWGGKDAAGYADISLLSAVRLDYELGGEMFGQYLPVIMGFLPAVPKPDTGMLDGEILDDLISVIQLVAEELGKVQKAGGMAGMTPVARRKLFKRTTNLLEMVSTLRGELSTTLDREEEEFQDG